MQPFRSITLALALTFGATACGGEMNAEETQPGTVDSTSTVPVASADISSTTSTPDLIDQTDTGGGVGDVALSPLAALVESAGNMRLDLDGALDALGPEPVGLSIPDIDLVDVRVKDVGVQANGEMEIPGATEVGWYRWSPSPGEPGSSVLAAHIAFGGRDGVFRNLDDLQVGDRFVVHYDDDSTREFEITERAQYDKKQLPLSRIFSKDGGPSVVLITCGGDFNRSANAYVDNVVAYAIPVGSGQ
jgi:LPXTG-site transpeptidase (sortase) family protein